LTPKNTEAVSYNNINVAVRLLLLYATYYHLSIFKAHREAAFSELYIIIKDFR